jgi:hypothetical protein
LIGEIEPVKVVLSTEFTNRSRPMPINSLYHTWFQRIQELRPGQRITQIRNIVWLIVGIYQSRSVCLSRIAGKIPGRAKLLSTTRRLSRLLDNPAIRVREWYAPIAQGVAGSAVPEPGRDPFDRGWHEDWFRTSIVDRLPGLSETSYSHRLDLGQARQGTQHCQQAVGFVGLCSQLIPQKAAVFLVGDCEFGSWKSCDNWIAGVGSMFCARNPIPMLWLNESKIGNHFGSFIQNPVKVSGWERLPDR